MITRITFDIQTLYMILVYQAQMAKNQRSNRAPMHNKQSRCNRIATFGISDFNPVERCTGEDINQEPYGGCKLSRLLFRRNTVDTEIRDWDESLFFQVNLE